MLEHTVKSPMHHPLRVLQETVVGGGYCIGCGACTMATEGQPIRIQLDKLGQYTAQIDTSHDDQAQSAVLAVCPFYPEGPNEDQIGEELFGQHAQRHHEIGYHTQVYAARVTDTTLFEQSSSGGVARWVLGKMLERGLVDKVIHVESVDSPSADTPLFRFAVTDKPQDVLRTARSAYYPVEMSGVLAYVRENPGRYAITGVPCFLKAVRRLSRQVPLFQQRILFCVGIICGHLKSTGYAEMLAWQMGVNPSDLSGFDFRVKIPGKAANEKGVSALSRAESGKVFGPRIVQDLFGTNYGHGFFKYSACDFCDDVVAETADISIGDAWLKEYLHKGTSLVIVRNPTLGALVKEAIDSGQIEADVLTPDQAADSQRAGFRHRRQDLKYRLHLADQAGTWRPQKRVEPSSSHLDANRQQLVQARVTIATRSHAAFQEAKSKNDWGHFVKVMEPIADRYHNHYRPPLKRAIYGLLYKFGIANTIRNTLRGIKARVKPKGR